MHKNQIIPDGLKSICFAGIAEIRFCEYSLSQLGIGPIRDEELGDKTNIIELLLPCE
jgi:hypothetical protein